MTEKDKYVYNCYLETSRKLNNKPFKYRKDFEKFEETDKFIPVNKLSAFFNKFPNINIKDFFEAPYFVYNETQFDLNFYLTQKAIKAYTIYQTKFLPDNPDHEQSLLKIKASFLFIYKFCKQNKITFDEYTSFKSPGSQWHDFMIHLKNREISLYSLFVFPKFDSIILTYDSEIKNFTFGDTFQKINFYRTKYYSSLKAKKLCNIINTKLTQLL